MYRQLLKAWSTNNNFSFHRDFVKIMSKMEALFIQDIINLATLDKAHYVDGWFQCTTGFLQGSLNWTEKEQMKLLQKLKKKGYLSVERKGIPATRYVKINVGKLAADLENGSNKILPNGRNCSLPNGSNSNLPKGSVKNNTVRITQKEERVPPSPTGFISDIYQSPQSNGNGHSSEKKREYPQKCYQWGDELLEVVRSKSSKPFITAGTRHSRAEQAYKIWKGFGKDDDRMNEFIGDYREYINRLLGLPHIGSVAQVLQHLNWIDGKIAKVKEEELKERLGIQ